MKIFKKFMLNILKVFKLIIFIFTIAMMCLALLSITNINKSEGRSFLGYKVFIVLSNSMKPEFESGDIIIVKDIDTKDLDEGCIITFYSKHNIVVTHQIISKTEVDSKPAFITKGTNNNQEDLEPVFSENVIGEYQFSISKVGFFLNFLRTPIGYLLLVLIPLLIILAFNGINFIRLFNKYKREQKIELERQIADLKMEKQKNRLMKEELEKLTDQINQDNDNFNNNY